jgi:hypothetical protein
MWFDHRESASLPPWHVIALEVVDRDEHLRRDGATRSAAGGWHRFDE